MKFKKQLTKYGMQAALNVTACLAKQQRFEDLSNKLLGAVAIFSAQKIQDSRPRTIKELGTCWQNAFPSPKQVPLVDINEDTVYAEIRTPCPLKGSGDLKACHRMMAYDRAYMNHFGGKFVVLRSQAEFGVNVCKVAIQFADKDNSTKLVHAHERENVLLGVLQL